MTYQPVDPSKCRNLLGQVFGDLTVIELLGRRRTPGGTYWRCQCACGQTTEILGTSLTNRGIKSCGCWLKRLRPNDLTGQRFGRLIALSIGERVKKGNSSIYFWRCRCDCGVEKDIRGPSLTDGVVVSCGCFRRDVITTHGHTAGELHAKGGTPTYRSWAAMKARVHGSGNQYTRKHYTGRVDMDPRWESFETFLADMGQRPGRSHSIDREDGTKGYWPWNCRWATKAQQTATRIPGAPPTPLILEHNGRRMSVRAWAKAIGIHAATIRNRLDLGLPIERCLNPTRLPRMRPNGRRES